MLFVRVVLVGFACALVACGPAPEPTTPPAPVPIPEPPPDPHVLACGAVNVVGSLSPKDDATTVLGDRYAKPSIDVAMRRIDPTPPSPPPPASPPMPVRRSSPPPPPDTTPRFHVVLETPRFAMGGSSTSVTPGLVGEASADECTPLATPDDVGLHPIELAFDARGVTHEARVTDDGTGVSPYVACLLRRACRVTATDEARSAHLVMPVRLERDTAVVLAQPLPPPPAPSPPPPAPIDVTTTQSVRGSVTDVIAMNLRALVVRIASTCARGTVMAPGASLSLGVTMTPGQEARPDTRRVFRPEVRPLPLPRTPPLPTVLGPFTSKESKTVPRTVTICIVQTLGRATLPSDLALPKSRTDTLSITWPEGSRAE